MKNWYVRTFLSMLLMQSKNNSDIELLRALHSRNSKNIRNPLIFLQKMAPYSCFWRVPSSKRGCRTSKYFLLGGSPALCPNGGEIGCDFAPVPYKHSSFPDIPFGMPDFKLFCFQPLKSMLSLMKKDDSPFFRSESCNEAY